MARVLAFISTQGAPLVGPATTPQIQIRRADTGAVAVAWTDVDELGDGLFAFEFTAAPSLEYAYLIDADPLAAGQVSAPERYSWGGVSGIQDQAIEVTLPAIPAQVWEVDLTAMTGGFVTAGEQLNAVRQFGFNRLDASPGSPGALSLYLDDGSTVRVTYTLRDHTAAGVVGVAGVPALRGAAA